MRPGGKAGRELEKGIGQGSGQPPPRDAGDAAVAAVHRLADGMGRKLSVAAAGIPVLFRLQASDKMERQLAMVAVRLFDRRNVHDSRPGHRGDAAADDDLLSLIHDSGGCGLSAADGFSA